MKNNPAEESIMEATLSVVDRHTINGTRLRLVAQEAGMSQSNLHYYYKSKQSLLIALLQYIKDDFVLRRATMLRDVPENLHDKLNCFFEQKKDIIRDAKNIDHVQIEYWCQGQVDPEINRMFHDMLSNWRGHIVDAILQNTQGISVAKARMIAHIMISMMLGLSLQYESTENPLDLDEYFEICLELLLPYFEKI